MAIMDEPVACVHDVSCPEGYVPRPPNPSSTQEDSKPAKEFPFTLDPFQSEAIKCLDGGESVMVSAHTSAGKTVVALYAIAMSLQNKQRVIYTSPIKALSYQKYREFKEEFSDVGLMTGDVTIKPNASCLVMTTEIWRSMQYKGSEVVREVARIILMRYITCVIGKEIGLQRSTGIHVILSITDYRPTPLQHYIFPCGGDGLYLVVDEKGKFREESFQKALNALVPTSEGDQKRGSGKWQKGLILGKAGEESDIFKMVKMIIQRQYDPVILFSFSKKECEFLAMQAANYLNIKSLLDLTCQTVADMIKGKTPEEIRKTFNIKNDFTPEEEEEPPEYCIRPLSSRVTRSRLFLRRAAKSCNESRKALKEVAPRQAPY
ncbi:hypothetical protein F0562_020201 [Nyssa sinensis]|uniref:Helicase ATP-binding domain-containing protein n=1 Tax=Nyssa sinensis TaxID=561372 RepID=A0A5J5BUH3_9ASTE|nr:hypothetical protein F0562_020201 [Nyssa sinensis]